MNKIAWIALIAGLVGIGLYMASVNNSLVDLDEGVKKSWSQVEVQYQRRADLIPNLVETVKGYASHERETLQGVIEARSKATATTIDPTNLTEESLQAFQNSQNGLSQALSRLMVVVEKYPDLKANENFKELQSQLEGTENRIATARRDFNEVTEVYNASVRKFPRSLFASILGFDSRPYFAAQAGSDSAPQVSFGK